MNSVFLQSIREWLSQPETLWLLTASLLFFLAGFFLRGRSFKKRQDPIFRGGGVKGDKSFFKGVQYLLSNDHDQAIEEFTKSVQVNSDTIETYVALGNLYRSKGDIDRAIRIRQSIILRPHLDEQIKIEALIDLGKDYLKGGFLNRALKTFLEVSHKNPSHVDTLKEIERIYEELKDWEKAYGVRQKIARFGGGDHQHILAHHLVEMGKAAQERDALNEARSLFERAASVHKACVDAYLHLGDLFFARQDYKKAISTWKKVVEVAPPFAFLAYGRLEGAYSEMKNLKPVEEFLRECVSANADAFTHMALARFLYNERDREGALNELGNALELNPVFWEARRFKGQLLLEQGNGEDIRTEYEQILEVLQMPYLRFQCSRCGFEPSELQWKCPQCKQWDTIGFLDAKESIIEPVTSENQKDRPHLGRSAQPEGRG